MKSLFCLVDNSLNLLLWTECIYLTCIIYCIFPVSWARIRRIFILIDAYHWKTLIAFVVCFDPVIISDWNVHIGNIDNNSYWSNDRKFAATEHRNRINHWHCSINVFHVILSNFPIIFICVDHDCDLSTMKPIYSWQCSWYDIIK